MIKIKVYKDEQDFVACCDKYPEIIGVGETKQRAITEFKIILREYLDYLKLCKGRNWDDRTRKRQTIN